MTGLCNLARLGAVGVIVLAAPAYAATPTAVATFKCKDGKSIDASFYADKVDLKLSDGRSFESPSGVVGIGRALRQQGRKLRLLEQGRYGLHHRRRLGGGDVF